MDLAKLNRIEPCRFTAKTGAIRALRWEILTEEQHLARFAMKRAIRAIRFGEVLSNSVLRPIVLYLPNPRLEKETKWTRNIFYALSTQAGVHRLLSAKKVLTGNDLPDIRFHDLRHTFATHALANGVDVKTLSGILGHTKASFTVDTYTHTTSDMRRKAAEIVGGFLTDYLGEEMTPWQSAENAKAAASN